MNSICVIDFQCCGCVKKLELMNFKRIVGYDARGSELILFWSWISNSTNVIKMILQMNWLRVCHFCNCSSELWISTVQLKNQLNSKKNWKPGSVSKTFGTFSVRADTVALDAFPAIKSATRFEFVWLTPVVIAIVCGLRSNIQNND